MNQLYKLKKFGNKGLSITDDFTINERKKIKEMCVKARKMNFDNDGDFVWCVRGNPRTSLRLIKKSRNSDCKSSQSLTSSDEELLSDDA